MLLQDRVIIIAGVGPGVGHALAVRAAAQGAKLVLVGRTSERLEAFASEIAAASGVALPVVCDLASVSDCRRLAETAVTTFGAIHGLAVVAYRPPDQKTLAESDDDLAAWRDVIDFNVFATLQVIKAVVERMADGGSIAIVNSMTSDLPWPRLGPYAAAKAALASFVRTLALEFAPRRIRINGMHAGGIANASAEAYLQLLAERGGRTLEEQRALTVATYPLGFIPPPENYADALIYLLSDLSVAMTGQAMHVNGGHFMR
jgi:NAD(P)-dependent dehydrogenase (short-subunit alcohol dehydrogenase family)